MSRDVDPKMAAQVAHYDQQAHVALEALRLIVDIMIAGFDGDELDSKVSLENLLAERDAAIDGLVETALDRGTPPLRCAEMKVLLTDLWNKSPSIKNWMDREFTITGV